MKSTSKPVTDVRFPAITICTSGFQMNNVEKKIEENFVNWRRKNKRNDGSKEATQKDVEDFMFSVFQIKTEGNRTEEVNILDILDTMISPNGEASLAVNSPRENAFACEMKREAIERLSAVTRYTEAEL